jgi:prepilin signal peptidase PulO-like enzyme (type II secretory pathway)
MFICLGYLLIFLVSLRIALVDIKTYYIRNSDLFLLFLLVVIFIDFSLTIGFVNFLIHLLLYLVTGKKLGFGDVKLAFVIGLSFNALYPLLVALNSSWIMGGVWALFSKQTKIAFAPWMLFGAFIAQISLK